MGVDLVDVDVGFRACDDGAPVGEPGLAWWLGSTRSWVPLDEDEHDGLVLAANNAAEFADLAATALSSWAAMTSGQRDTVRAGFLALRDQAIRIAPEL